MASLVLPYLSFIAEKQELLRRELVSPVSFQESVAQLKNIVVSLFEKNILTEASLKGQEDRVIMEVFKLYLSLQSGLLKGSN